MGQSVELSEDVMALVRREAEHRRRSLASQVTHWVKLGRAIEHSGAYDHAHITAALAGRLDTAKLSEAEEAAWLDAFTDRMAQCSNAERDFYARREVLGQGVGLDAAGNLVHAGKGDQT
jgi:hypothetical protein